MKHPIQHTWPLAAMFLGLVVQTSGLGAQVDQNEIAHKLLSEDRREQGEALRWARELPPAAVGQPLRAALVRVVERDNAMRQERLRAILQGATDPDYDERDNFALEAIDMAVALRDPQVIPALSGALDTGTRVPRAMADFGERAAPYVLETLTSQNRLGREVRGALLALRFMVEDPGEAPLSDETSETIRQVARERLEEPLRPGEMGFPSSVLGWAVDLAIALDDPELRGTVEALATDPMEVAARGVTDPNMIRRIQVRATERLAGVPALPPRH